MQLSQLALHTTIPLQLEPFTVETRVPTVIPASYYEDEDRLCAILRQLLSMLPHLSVAGMPSSLCSDHAPDPYPSDSILDTDQDVMPRREKDDSYRGALSWAINTQKARIAATKEEVKNDAEEQGTHVNQHPRVKEMVSVLNVLNDWLFTYHRDIEVTPNRLPILH